MKPNFFYGPMWQILVRRTQTSSDISSGGQQLPLHESKNWHTVRLSPLATQSESHAHLNISTYHYCAQFQGQGERLPLQPRSDPGPSVDLRGRKETFLGPWGFSFKDRHLLKRKQGSHDGLDWGRSRANRQRAQIAPSGTQEGDRIERVVLAGLAEFPKYLQVLLGPGSACGSVCNADVKLCHSWRSERQMISLSLAFSVIF